MAESVKINGTIYGDVPEVKIPKSDDTGDATFYDTANDTAAANEVLAGKTFHTASGGTTGTMVNNGATGGYINVKAGTVSIPAGYTSGGTVAIDSTEQGKIVTDNIKNGVAILGVQGKSTVVDTEITASAAAAGNITTGKKAFVNGQEITGTLTAVTVTQDSTTKVLTIS